MTDFVHHLNPAVIAIGIGLLLSLPKVGVLDAKAIKAVNFLSIIFIGGALSMAMVLIERNWTGSRWPEGQFGHTLPAANWR